MNEHRGLEPWSSSGYGRWLIFERLWVWIPVPYTGLTWHFFILICCKNCIVCFKKTKNKQKRGWGLTIFFKKRMNIAQSHCPAYLCDTFIELITILFSLSLWSRDTKSVVLTTPSNRNYEIVQSCIEINRKHATKTRKNAQKSKKTQVQRFAR